MSSYVQDSLNTWKSRQLLRNAIQESRAYTYAFSPSLDTIFTDKGEAVTASSSGDLEYRDWSDNLHTIPIVAGVIYPIEIKEITSNSTASGFAVFVR